MTWLSVLWLVLAAAGAGGAGGGGESSDTAAAPETRGQRVEALLASMSLEQKVGQLMMVGFGGKEMGPGIERLLTDFHVGSVALYSRNVRSPQQVSELIRGLRRAMADEIQPFVAIDQEGGNVVRVRSEVAVLPGTMTLGATRDPVLAFLAGQSHAIDLRLLGFDMNLAPVLDINHNPRNPVINVRAFGDSPELVAQLGVAFVRGQQAAGLATVAKHFPGHGTTEHDSHFALPRIQLPRETLLATELLPFQRAIDAGLDALMTAHVQVPAVDPDGTPASLSRRLIGELLRGRLGFDGLVITDDLEMRAISETRGVGPAAVQAVQAGADIVMVIWTPRRKREVFESLLQAARSGTIPAARLDASVRRILRLKARRGTLDRDCRGGEDAFAYLPNAYHQQVARTIAVRGLTLVANQRSLLPLCTGRGVLVATPYRLFGREMARLLPGSEVLSLRLVSSRRQRQRELERVAARARDQRLVVIAAGNVYQAWLIQQLTRRLDKPVVAVSFGSPYLLRHFPQVAGYLCTYSYLPVAQRAAAQALTGHQSITGKLPVSLSTRYRRGHGLTVQRNACARSTAAR